MVSRSTSDVQPSFVVVVVDVRVDVDVDVDEFSGGTDPDSGAGSLQIGNV